MARAIIAVIVLVSATVSFANTSVPEPIHPAPNSVLEAREVTLEFPVRLSGAPSGSDSVGGRIVPSGSGYAVRALSSISFTLAAGERMALLGGNGSGKSTLLRTCAGIYRPSTGSMTISGRISTLFSSTLGLNQALTGRRNIDIGLRLLGIPAAEIPDCIAEVIEFSELGDFIDLPIHTYSAGMSSRLGFSIVTSMRPDILLIDEVFGAGDVSFVDKARERLHSMASSAGSVIMASHAPAVLEKFCESALWIDHGEQRAYGPLSDVFAEYRDWMKKHR